MKTIKEHKKAIIKHYKSLVDKYDSLFELKVYMISLHICPNCGEYLSRWSSRTGHFPCFKCEFNLTEDEVEKVLWDYDDRVSEKMKKSILKRKFKKVYKTGGKIK